MTSHIRRFPQSFGDLLDSPQLTEKLAGLTGLERDDALITEYMAQLKRAGKFPYVLPAIVLHPENDRTHFHLIYATRHPKGVEAFKDTEKRAMEEMERIREKAQRRRREERTRQQEFLFGAAEIPQSHHYNSLRDHYLDLAREAVLNRLRQQRRLIYDSAWLLALSQPLVWESDLRNWLKEWKEEGRLQLEGLQRLERVPKRDSSHFLIWQEEHRR
jgi:hypothetical protein